MNEPNIRAECSECGMEFAAEPPSGEAIEDVLRRVRAQFEGHTCERA